MWGPCNDVAWIYFEHRNRSFHSRYVFQIFQNVMRSSKSSSQCDGCFTQDIYKFLTGVENSVRTSADKNDLVENI